MKVSTKTGKGIGHLANKKDYSMGRFLTTSLVTEFSIQKSDLELVPLKSKSEVQKLLLGTTEKLFESKEDETGVVFRIKENLLQEELIGFLEVFYADLHGEDVECKEILDTLRKKAKVEEWLSIARKKSFEKFQTTDYQYAVFHRDWNRITVNYSSIILVLEGKISMETYGKQFSFFESLIRKTYVKYRISNLVKVAISG